MTERVGIVIGASRGIGRATAIRPGRDFGAVAFVARTRDTLAETGGAVRAAEVEPLVLARDLRQPDAAGAVVTVVRKGARGRMTSSEGSRR